MKKILLIIVAIIVLLLSFMIFSKSGQNYLYSVAMDAAEEKAGFVQNTVQIDDHEIVYLDRASTKADAQVIVLLHGFSSNKHTWLTFSTHIDASFRVIVIDWAAHGESTYKPTGDYSLVAQSNRLKMVFDKLNIPKAHLVGNSMGGAIAADFASRFQGKVSTLTLMNSGGADDSTSDTEMEKGLKEGKLLLLVEKPEDYDRTAALAMVDPIKIPYPIEQAMIMQSVNRYERFKNVFLQILNDGDEISTDYLKEISAPTLILWGEQDKILGVENAKIFDENISNTKLIIYKNVGHVPMLEIPEQSAKDISEFIMQH
ncbi:alpha/beta fold hydrolase [Oceaniserpentilla sp. 4NH20-0058]|uniref:alpha/beta fold hydrolase n=1 Tax=Oceaniserpentilla sp. 4NH20-0058 TaxID=3127660 RepID=UPI003101C72B